MRKKQRKILISITLTIAIVLVLGFYLYEPKQSTLQAGNSLNSQQELSEDDILMIEQCKEMPEMPGCEPYLLMAEELSFENKELPKKLSRSIVGLENVQPPSVIRPLDNKISISADPVKLLVDDKLIRGYGYNKQIPGPTIKVNQGDIITVDFTNNLDLETTVHWHGLRLENSNDGVPNLTQDPIKPGDSFIYELYFPDPGLYWYHPHVRTDYQQDLGLYGAIYVQPKEEDYFNKVNREEVVFIDDIYIDGDDVYNYLVDKENLALMGRFGNVMLTNGKEKYELKVNKNEVVRFFFVSPANTRTFKISIPNARMKLIGSDGGAYVEEEFVEGIIISPSERYIVEVLQL